MESTFSKGKIALAAAIKDLSQKGYDVFIPIAGEHLRFDLVVHKYGKCYRVQVKYSSNGEVRGATIWKTKEGYQRRIYNHDDFDYYAVYLPSVDAVVYSSIKLANVFIRTEMPKTPCEYLWYEDLQDFTDEVKRRTCSENLTVATRKPRANQKAETLS